jgi:outer membrane protein assembly factor BamA
MRARGLLLALLVAAAAPLARADAESRVWGPVEVRSTVPLGPLGFDGELGVRGRPADGRHLDRAVDRLLEDLSRAGHPFATARLEEVDLVDGRIVGVLVVDPGPRATVEGLLLEGATTTRPRTAERVAGVRPGQTYTGREAERVRERLLASGLFTTVGEVQVLPGSAPGAVILRTTVEEPPYTNFTGALGVAGPDRELTGLLDLRLENLAGTAREASAAWENRGEGLSRFAVAYREPWLPWIPLGLAGSLAHDVNEGVYSYTQWEVAGDLSIGPRWALRLGLGGAHAVRTDLANVTSDESYVLWGASYDSRSSLRNPLGGFHLTLESRQGSKDFRIDGSDGVSVDRTRWRAAGSAYRRVGAPWLLAVRSEFRFLDTPEDSIPRYDLIAVGGANSLRGYREEQFLTPLAWTFQTEWRLLQGSRGSALYAFVDGGWIAERAPDDTWNRSLDRFLLGYGLGVRQASRLGMLGVAYGIARGEGVLDGRVHLRLDAAF